MGNTKRFYYILFTGITPYFKEEEFVHHLKDLEIDNKKLYWDWIDIKGRIFNELISHDTESYTDKLRCYCHICIRTLEHNIFSNISLSKNLFKKRNQKWNYQRKVN